MKIKAIGFLFVVSIIYIVFAKYTQTIMPEIPYNQGVEIIKSYRPVNITGYKAFNASLLPLDEGYLFASRRRGDSFIHSLWKKYILGKNIKGLIIGELDKNFNETSQIKTEYVSLDKLKAEELQYIDPRLVSIGKDIYMIYCRQRNSSTRNTSTATLSLAKLEKIDGSWQVISDTAISFDQGQEFYEKGLVQKGFEKNWMPFVSENELYFIYLMEPEHVILKADLNSGKVFITNRSSNSFDQFNAARGSTCPLFDEELGEWITLYHFVCPSKRKITNKKANVYFFGAYSFSKDPPYKVLRKTDGPITGRSLYDNFYKIIFPMTLLKDNENYLIFYGNDDTANGVAKIARKDLINAMKKVEDIDE